MLAVTPGSTPERPAAVPPDAVFNRESWQWERAELDAEGRRAGILRAWRRDGALTSEQTYRAGVPHGPFRRFHPDGTLAREGAFVDGAPHGTVIAYASDAPGAEPLRPCCVPPGAWRMQIDFSNGLENENRFFDRAGLEILPNGLPVPPRPASLPADARYDWSDEHWIVSQCSARGEAEGVWRRWSKDGVLREHQEFSAGRLHGAWRRFDEHGTPIEEGGWTDGERDGPYRAIGVPPGRYRDSRIHEERGAFARGRAIGAWSFRDQDGAVLRELELGPALGDAILAASRAAAAAGHSAALRDLLERATPPLTPQAAAGMAAEAAKRAEAGGESAWIADGLARGGDPTMLLRALASALMASDAAAALAHVDVALLLAPGHAECHVTRALVNLHLGRPAAARADAAALPSDRSGSRAFLELYTRVIFPDFAFWPAAVEVAPLFPQVPAGPDQPLGAVRAQVRKLAARLAAIREAIASRLTPGDARDWLPPDLTALVRADDEPLALSSWEFEEVVVDDPDGPEPPPTLVKVDERPSVDGQTIPSLMRLARRDWNAVCWLCWSAGLDRVALPDELRPPELFGQAAGLSVARVWRCRDQLSTAGLRSMTQGFPGFSWEGVDIDGMPSVLAEIATEEYLEMRAIFYWLCDAGIQSPWQDNLRGE
jgi:antitoxin component YwqK of YwqJK toxin-antitoxin module